MWWGNFTRPCLNCPIISICLSPRSSKINKPLNNPEQQISLETIWPNVTTFCGFHLKVGGFLFRLQNQKELPLFFFFSLPKGYSYIGFIKHSKCVSRSCPPWLLLTDVSLETVFLNLHGMSYVPR